MQIKSNIKFSKIRIWSCTLIEVRPCERSRDAHSYSEGNGGLAFTWPANTCCLAKSVVEQTSGGYFDTSDSFTTVHREAVQLTSVAKTQNSPARTTRYEKPSKKNTTVNLPVKAWARITMTAIFSETEIVLGSCDTRRTLGEHLL